MTINGILFFIFYKMFGLVTWKYLIFLKRSEKIGDLQVYLQQYK